MKQPHRAETEKQLRDLIIQMKKDAKHPQSQCRARGVDAFITPFCKWLYDEMERLNEGDYMAELVLVASEILGLQAVLLTSLAIPGKEAGAAELVLGVIKQELKAKAEKSKVSWM